MRLHKTKQFMVSSALTSRFATSPNFSKQQSIGMPYRAYGINPTMKINMDRTG